MRLQVFSIRCCAFAVLAVTLFSSVRSTSQETPIFSFYSSYFDALPKGPLATDAAGNLYGTTFYGGAYGNGMVYELTPTAAGWTQTVLHSFSPDGADGFAPTSGIIFDSAGNIFGTTQFGGSGSCTNGFGCGTIFELTPAGGGIWKETILHDFAGNDGWEIHSGLIMDGAGNLFGMATNGGTHNNGTVFELSPSAGSWTLTVLHQFTGGSDGGVPYDGLTLDAAGNLYGTTSAGGGKSAACRYGCGVVFKLSRGSSGTWTESVLHNFSTSASDGSIPSSKVIFDAAGNLYGTASSGGGSMNAGIVFKLTPTSSGTWTETVLHNFSQHKGDGVYPGTTLTFDAAGNLYGVTLGGGTHGSGTAFRLSPTASGAWTETILGNFSRQGAGGYFPNGPLMLGADGNLYGVAASGGRNGQGTVFYLAP